MRYRVDHIISTATRSTNTEPTILHHIYGRDIYSDNHITPIVITREGNLIYDRGVNNPHNYDEAHHIATQIIQQILQQPQTAPNLITYRYHTTAPYGTVAKAIDFIDKTYTIEFPQGPTTAQQTATASPATPVSPPGSPATPLDHIDQLTRDAITNVETALDLTLDPHIINQLKRRINYQLTDNLQQDYQNIKHQIECMIKHPLKIDAKVRGLTQTYTITKIGYGSVHLDHGDVVVTDHSIAADHDGLYIKYR